MRHKLSGSAPGPTDQVDLADQAQAAFEFGDAQQPGVPELVSEAQLWEADPRAAVRSWMTSTKKSSGKDFNERSITQYVSMVGAACDFWAAGQGSSILSAAVADLEAFLSRENRRGKPSSDSTRRRYLGLLQSVFDHLVEAGLRDSNPARNLLQVPANSMVERADPVFLTPEEMIQLREWVCGGPADDWQEARNRALIGAFAATGITTSEAQALSYTGREAHDGKISLYLRHRVDDKSRFVTSSTWCTAPMLRWFELRKNEAPRLLLGETGGPLFPANLKRSDESAFPRPAHSLSDTEIYVIVAEALATISPHAAQHGPQTLRNSYITTQLLAGVKDAKLMTDLGLETSFTLDVLRKQLVDRGLLDPKIKRSMA